MSQKRIVHLRVYRGREINYDKNGKVKNENHLIKSTEDSVEFNNVLKYISQSGYCKVEVEKVFKKTDKGYEQVDSKEIEELVNEAINGKVVEKELTPDQKRIEQLERMVKELSDAKQPKAKKQSEKPKGDDLHELPKGKTIDNMSKKQLETSFPEIADLNPANLKEFRTLIRTTYPDKF